MYNKLSVLEDQVKHFTWWYFNLGGGGVIFFFLHVLTAYIQVIMTSYMEQQAQCEPNDIVKN